MIKRSFDIFVAAALLVLLFPIILAVIICIWLQGDGPIFFVSERMKSVQQSFQMVKFRTMRAPREGEVNYGVSGGDKADRITPLGRKLRKFRLDELPQLLNILKGDMSFVGPRPPLRRYTERYPSLYAKVLKSKPGVTGLASVFFHKTEERLLAQARTADETEEIYERLCIPRKARLDMIYQKKADICCDIWLLFKTLEKVLVK